MVIDIWQKLNIFEKICFLKAGKEFALKGFPLEN